ncbi:MAG TPA: hypothetical protein ENN99_14315 [Chloroflexi bacterium]|nr:hypothetical protein [Chloroflexota bacterium]
MANVTLQEAVKKFASDLAEKVNTFMEDISTLEVRTYSTPADQVQTFVQGDVDFTKIMTEGKIALRAYTKVSFDGDTTVVVPTEMGGEVHGGIWAIHESVVQQAMANRTEMIKAIGDTATSALRALGLASGE